MSDDFGTQAQRDYLAQGGDPNDPQFAELGKEGSGAQGDPGTASQPGGTPGADPGDLFDLVYKGNKEQYPREKILEFAQQGRDYSEKMKGFKDTVQAEANRIIGDMIAKGQLATPSRQGREGSEGPEGFGGTWPPNVPQQNDPRFPGQLPPAWQPPPWGNPQTQQQQVQPQYDPYTGQWFIPQGEQVTQPPQNTYGPDPNTHALYNQMAQMQQRIAQMQEQSDSEGVRMQKIRLSGLLREGSSRYNLTDPQYVALRIQQSADPDALTDEEILGFCKESHEMKQGLKDQAIQEYLDSKKKHQRGLPPHMGGAGVPPPPTPSGPIKSFSDARTASEEYLKNIS